MSVEDVRTEMIAAQQEFCEAPHREMIGAEEGIWEGGEQARQRADEARQFLVRIVRASLPTLDAYAGSSIAATQQSHDHVARVADAPEDRANVLIQNILQGTATEVAKIEEMRADTQAMGTHAEAALGHLAAFFQEMDGFSRAYESLQRHQSDALDAGRQAAFGFEQYIANLG